MSFQEALQLFRTQYKGFRKLEGREWGAEGAVIEMMKQVGELAKYVMVAERYYPEDIREKSMEGPRGYGYETLHDAIGDELADVFSMIIRLSDHYGIDLEKAHIRARQGEADYLSFKNL